MLSTLDLTSYQLDGMFSRELLSQVAMPPAAHESKAKFLNAALRVIRTKGYEAATIDDICDAAKLTKGSFFHHFAGKEQFAVAAAQSFADGAEEVFANAPYQSLADPLARLLGYVDFRKEILRGALPEYTCFLGTLVQESYETHPAIRRACDAHLREHCAMLEADISAAMRLYAADAPWSAAALAFHIQAVIQGAFILAKAQYGPSVAADCLDHLRRYVELLFRQSNPRE
jgi:TetR/AcrR family transcriptional regulator, transcriptional repressor for nem operon